MYRATWIFFPGVLYVLNVLFINPCNPCNLLSVFVSVIGHLEQLENGEFSICKLKAITLHRKSYLITW